MLLSALVTCISSLVWYCCRSNISHTNSPVAGRSLEYYQEFYSEERPALGFVSWKVIDALQLDHIYTAPYFLGLALLLGLSLVACSSTQQLPMVKAARRWRQAPGFVSIQVTLLIA
jgi:cytochrome c biogenesis protein ResB